MHILTDNERKARDTFLAECCLRGILPAITVDDHGRELVILSRGALTRQFTSTAEAHAGLASFDTEETNV